MQAHATFEKLIAATLADWFSWVVTISAASAAFLAVCFEHLVHKLMLRRSKTQLEEEIVVDDFLPGVKMLVGQAFSNHLWWLRLWRWLEVLVASFWLGFSFLIMGWHVWLPLVAVAYILPAAGLHGFRKLLSTPVLTIMTKGMAAQAIFMLGFSTDSCFSWNFVVIRLASDM